MNTTPPADARHTPAATPTTSHPPDAHPATPDAPQAAPVVPLLALSRPQAAQALGISTRLLDDLTRSHELPSVKLGGRVVFPVALLNEYLAEQCRKGARR